MIKDYKMKACLARMTSIEERMTGDTVKDYQLLYTFKDEIKGSSRKNNQRKIRANLGLIYLLLFHPSALVRHEAAFVLGEYGDRPVSFLRVSALADSSAVVRHEASLALSTYSQRALAERNVSVLEYISRNDKTQLVKDTAKVALNLLSKKYSI